MDAKVSNAVITEQKLGNLKPEFVQFFDKERPTIATGETMRVAFLRFKTNSKNNTKRENMAVLCNLFDVDALTSKSEHDMLQSLFNDYHDSVLVRCSDGEVSWDDANSLEWIIKDFNDNSRTRTGRKVTKESIAAWYDANVAELVRARAITKNAQMTKETQDKVVSGYREMFQKFTGYNLANLFTDAQLSLLDMLMVSVEVTEENGEILEFLLERSQKIKDQRKANDSLVDAI